MKFRAILCVILFIFAISSVSAYQWVCFEDGEDMYYPGVTCTTGDPNGCCTSCASDSNYQSLPSNCIAQDSCSCDGIVGNAFNCTESWSCTSFSECGVLGTQTRGCIDINSCGTELFKPEESQSCVTVGSNSSNSSFNYTDVMSRLESLETDVSTLNSLMVTLQNFITTIQNQISSILARLSALETSAPPPAGCLYENPACDQGFNCVDNICVEGTLNGCAYNNPSCESGYECTDNVCVEIIPDGCAYNNPSCVSGYECTDNVCVEIIPDGCTYNNPSCESGYECTDNVCVEIIPPGCTYNNPSCESGYQCVANECVIPEDEVIFRTNVENGRYWSSNGEIVFDYDGDGDLDCLKYNSYYRYYSNRQPTILARTPEGYEVHTYSDKTIIKTRDNYIYALSDTCVTPLTVVPTEPYSSNGQEILS